MAYLKTKKDFVVCVNISTIKTGSENKSKVKSKDKKQ